MELVLPLYNAHPYLSLKNLGKNSGLFAQIHELDLICGPCLLTSELR